MRYLLLFLIGIVLFFLGLVALKAFTNAYLLGYNSHILFHWLVFGVLTAAIPKISMFIIKTETNLKTALIIGISCLFTVLIVWVMWYDVSRPRLNENMYQINFLYITEFYAISILLILSCIKRMRL